MRFIANFVMNAQRFAFETNDVILSLYKGILPIYYIRCEVITG